MFSVDGFGWPEHPAGVVNLNSYSHRFGSVADRTSLLLPHSTRICNKMTQTNDIDMYLTIENMDMSTTYGYHNTDVVPMTSRALSAIMVTS